MVNSALEAGMYGSVFAAAIALPFVMRKPKSLEELYSEVDENICHRLNKLLQLHEDTSEREIWEAVGGVRGALYLVKQARVMIAVLVEQRMQGACIDSDIDRMQGMLASLVLAYRGCRNSWLLLRNTQALSACRMCAVQFTRIANYYDDLLNEIDADTVPMFS